MKRRRALRNAAVTASLISAGCIGRIERVASDWSIESDWRTYRSDSQNTNYVPEAAGPQSETILWKESVKARSSLQPVIVDNTVYVANSPGNTPGSVRALDATTGGIEWESDVDSGIGTTPTVLDQVLVVGVDNNGVIGFDLTSGERLWSIPVESPFGETGFALAGDQAYVVTRNGVVVAFESSGDELWRTNLSLDDDLELHVQQIIKHDGLVYTGTRDGMHVLDADTGEHQWSYAQGRRVPKGPIANRNTVYLTHSPGRTEGGSPSQIDAVDPQTGEQKWSHYLGREFAVAPSTDGNLVFVSDLSPSRVLAFDHETGEKRWETEISAPMNDGPTIATEELFAPTLNGIEVLDPSTGERVRKIAPDSYMPFLTSPCIVDTIAIITTSRGTLYAIGDP